MKFIPAILALVFAAIVMAPEIRAADPPPPASTQERDDQFMYQGQSLDRYNPHSQKLRGTGVWSWRFSKNPVCPGDVRPFVITALSDMRTNFQINFIEDPLNGNLIYQSCGPELASKCGSTSINCLPDSYPYNVTIYLSSYLAEYFPVSSVSIVLHEQFHAMATWNEQYRRTADGGFAASEDQTVMNVGPASRHAIGQLERERWWRTMGSPELKTVGRGFNGTNYLYACGFDKNATRLSVLYEDYGPRYWSGVIKEIKPDANGCMGIGEFEGVYFTPERRYFLKQENPASWSVSFNETLVP